MEQKRKRKRKGSGRANSRSRRRSRQTGQSRPQSRQDDSSEVTGAAEAWSGNRHVIDRTPPPGYEVTPEGRPRTDVDVAAASRESGGYPGEDGPADEY